MDERITQIHRDECCVRRAVWLMALLTGLAVAGLAYSAVLLENISEERSLLIAKVLAALGMASLSCLVVFVALRKIYRMRSEQQREECRQLVSKLLESRLSKPATQPGRESRAVRVNRETAAVATEVAQPH